MDAYRLEHHRSETQPKPLAADGKEPLGRLFSVLELVIKLGMVSASDVTDMLGIPKPTAHRLIAQLETAGFLQRMPLRGKYAAALKLVAFAKSVLGSTMAYAPMRAVLEVLSQKTGETHNISVMSMGELQFVAAVERSISVAQVQVGQRAPLHATASGQVFLADLEPRFLERHLKTGPWEAYSPYTICEPEALKARLTRVRSLGFAIIDSEYVIGTVGVAVPIRSPKTNKVVACMGCITSNQRYNVSTAVSLAHSMRSYADRISRLL